MARRRKRDLIAGVKGDLPMDCVGFTEDGLGGDTRLEDVTALCTSLCECRCWWSCYRSLPMFGDELVDRHDTMEKPPDRKPDVPASRVARHVLLGVRHVGPSAVGDACPSLLPVYADSRNTKSRCEISGRS